MSGLDYCSVWDWPIDHIDSDGNTMLHDAVIDCYLSMAKNIIKDRPEQIYKLNRDGETPLMCVKGFEDTDKMVDLLIPAKWIRNNKGEFALHVFFSRRLLALYKVKNGRGETPFKLGTNKSIDKYHFKMEVWSSIFPLSFLT